MPRRDARTIATHLLAALGRGRSRLRQFILLTLIGIVWLLPSQRPQIRDSEHKGRPLP